MLEETVKGGYTTCLLFDLQGCMQLFVHRVESSRDLHTLIAMVLLCTVF